jgi:nicotinate-nucleotide pyrophosphorylase (carboxylating)
MTGMNPPADLITSFPQGPTLGLLIEAAKAEDLAGPDGRGVDVTSHLTIPESKQGTGTLLLKQPGVVCGLPLIGPVCRAYDPRLRVEPVGGASWASLEGCYHGAVPVAVARISGPMRSLLSAERVILNFLQHLSGVATLTYRFVEQVSGTHAKILDTRKTLPGYRALDKYAVRAGGGHNHRIGLYDGILIKDNHLAGLAPGEIAPWLGRLLAQARAEFPGQRVGLLGGMPLQVEVDTLEQLAEVLKVDGVSMVLLDNMDCPTMRRAVEMRDSAGRGRTPLLEASGGVNLQTVRAIALTGVDRISVGAITHSAPALDLSLEVEG